MYAAKAIDGVPIIQRDGENVLSVYEENWEFANWLCVLLNESVSGLVLTQEDRQWLKAMDGAFGRKVQHA